MAGTILVIEDNPENLDLMLYLLRAFGHRAVEARDGIEGLEAVAKEKPDLVICDIHMPRLDGFGVIRQLKANDETRSLPVIAVTALAMVGDAERVMGGGFSAYLSKPIDPETFVGLVEKFLRP